MSAGRRWQSHRPIRVWFPGMIILLAGFLLAGGRFGFPGHSFVFLTLDETSTAGLVSVPLAEAPAGATFNASTGALCLAAAADRPGKNTLAMVLWESDILGLRVASRVLRVDYLPYRISLASPLDVHGVAWEGGTARAGTVRVLDESRRLVAHDIELLSVSRDGSVTVRYGAEVTEIPAGGGWGEVRIEREGTVRTVRPGPEWEGALRQAFLQGLPVTRVTLFNHGLWRKDRVTY